MLRILLLTGLMLTLGVAAHAQWSQTSGPGGAELRGVVQYGETFIVFTSNGVYHRTGGEWERVGDAGSNLAINPVMTGDVLLAAFNRQMHRSTNLGRTWSPIETPFSGNVVEHVQLVPHGETLYVALTDTLYSTTDGGLSWSGTSVPGYINLVSVSDDAIIALESHFGFTLQGLIRSTDGGATWQDISGNLPADIHFMDFFPHNSSGLYMAYDDVIYSSTDNGDSWQRLVDIPDVLAESAGIQIDVRSSSNIFMVVQPGSLTGYRDVYHYDGNSWNLVRELGHGSTGAVITDDGLVVSTRSGLYMVDASTAKWVSLNDGLRASTNVVFASVGATTFTTAPNGVWSTTDAGESWNHVSDAIVTDLAATDAALIHSGQGIHRSTDMGATWERVDTMIINDVGMVVTWVTDIAAGRESLWVTEGYTSAGEHGQGGGWVTGGVYRSDDNGRTWRDVSSNLPHNGLTTTPVSQIFVEEDYVVVTTSSGMFRSTNQGASWSRIPGPPLRSSEYIHGIYGGNHSIMSVGDKGEVHRSSDGGQSWTLLGSLPDSTYVRGSWTFSGGGISEVGQEIYATTQRAFRVDSLTWGYEHKVFRYDGEGFVDITSSLPEGVQFYTFHRTGDVLLAGTQGRSVWKREIISSVGAPSASASGAAIAVAPSPFSGTATVTVHLQKPSNARVAILDSRGSEVARLHDGALPAGDTRLSLDGAGLSSGSYFISVQTESGRSVVGVVKVE